MATELDCTALAVGVVTDLAKTIASAIYSRAKNYLVDLEKKDEIDFGYAFEAYLINTKSQFSKIKTLLYRHEPKDLYTFYECIGLCYGDSNVDTSSVHNIMELGHKIIITGTGGIGKTVMLKHFYLNCINNIAFIPVMVELRGLNQLDAKEISIDKYIYETLQNHGCILEEKYFRYSLEAGCYLFLFDGYDELRGNLSERVSKDIMNLCSQYPNNYFILSSRPSHEFVGWSDFLELRAQPLSKEQALSLIDKLEYDPKVKQKFYVELDKTLYEKYKTFASNPLLLTIMLITYDTRASIPDKLNEFYEQAFMALFQTHDASKGAYKRDLLSGLGYEDFKSVFAYFCFKSFFKSEYEFTKDAIVKYIEMAKERVHISKAFDSTDYISDLTNAVCMLIPDGLHYKFSHRSFQEYFAAVYTMQLNDEVQTRLVLGWMKSGYPYFSSSYPKILSELQPYRFIKNILLPGLQELEKEYINNGKSTKNLLPIIYSKLSLSRFNEEEFHFYAVIKNNYLHHMIRLALLIFNYQRPSDGGLDRAKIMQELGRHYEAQGREFNVEFDQLHNEEKQAEINKCLLFFTDQIDFALSCIDKCDLVKIGRKRSVESILEEL